jgi:formate/nitrite transporter FocA (FNT family)
MNKQTQSQQIVADIAHQAQHEQSPSGFAQFVGAIVAGVAVCALIVLTFSL